MAEEVRAGINSQAKRQIVLSAAQHGIWLGQKINGNPALYNAGEIIEIHGALDLDRIADAIRCACSESQVLQQRFVQQDDGEVVQIATGNSSTYKSGSPVTLLDYRSRPPGSQESNFARACSWFKSHLSEPIDLANEPCYSNTLVILSDNRYLWCLRIHHIACDGYGFALLQQRVADLYNKAEIRPFGNYWEAIAQEQLYAGSDKAISDRKFWHSTLNGAGSPVTFTTRQSALETSAIHYQRTISSEDFAFIKSLAEKLQCAWSDILIAMVAALLVNRTAASNLTLGMPVMNRMGTAFVNIPAMTMNIAPLPLDLNAVVTWSELCKQVRDTVKQVRPHLRYRYEVLRRELNAVGGTKKLFGPIVNIMPFERRLNFAESEVLQHPVSSGPVDDIGFSFIVRQHNELLLRIEANPGNYSETELRSYAADLCELLPLLKKSYHENRLSALTLTIDQGDLSMLSGPELPDKHPDDDGLNPIMSRLYGEFECEAENDVQDFETRAAIEDYSEDRESPLSLSLSDVRSQVDALARGLIDIGVTEQDIIAFKMSRGREAIIGCLACWRLGACFVFLDPQGAEVRNQWIVEDARPKLVITAQEVRQLIAQNSELESAPVLAMKGCSESLLAYLIYTSGSTGKPKGVKITHAALTGFLLGADQVYGPVAQDRVLQFAPMHFDTCIEEIFLALLRGATLVIRHSKMTQSLPEFLRQLNQLQISWLDLPTAYWHELVYHCYHAQTPLPSNIKNLVIGGEAALPERIKQWHRISGNPARLINTYGPSETTVVATAQICLQHEDGFTIGSPLPGRHVAILGENGQWVPLGEEGELVIMGAGVGAGYVGQSGEKFGCCSKLVSSQFGDARWQRSTGAAAMPYYRTGDRARVNSRGKIEFRGRIDEEIKISGQRIHPTEVETAIATVSGIAQACVVVFQQNQQATLAAFVMAENPASGTEQGLILSTREALRQKLPASMVPALIKVVSSLPKTPSGKVDKKALAKQLEQDQSQRQLPGRNVANNAVQLAVIEAWQAVLGPIEINPDQDFFILGGESLQTIKVVNRLSTTLKREIPVSLLFQNPRVAEFAEAIEALGAPDTLSGTRSGTRSVTNGGITKGQRLRDQIALDSLLSNTQFPEVQSVEHPGPPRNILLTGASGFVGAHCLHALLANSEAQITCLLRGGQGLEKLMAALDEYRLAVNHEQLQCRIKVIQCNLEQPQLGLDRQTFVSLADSVDSIVHNAAITSVLRDYHSLKAVNLESTRSLLQLLAVKPKPFHYVSTIAVTQALEECYLDFHAGLKDGYQQTKWASERLLQQAADRGHHVNTYRLARVTGSFQTAYVNAKDLVWQIIRSSIVHGRFPDWAMEEPWTPVDVLANAISVNVLNPLRYGVINFLPQKNVALLSIYQWLLAEGYKLERVPLKEWHHGIAASDAAEDLALASFFDNVTGQEDLRTPGQSKSTQAGRSENGKALLGRSGLTLSNIDAGQFLRYLRHAVEQRLIAPVSYT